jgi:hypothetical protein
MWRGSTSLISLTESRVSTNLMTKNLVVDLRRDFKNFSGRPGCGRRSVSDLDVRQAFFLYVFFPIASQIIGYDERKCTPFTFQL